MIGKLKGTLIDIEQNTGLIETAGGVSYLSFLTPSIISRSHLEDTIELFTYLQVREDALVLFGFETKDQLLFFKLLLTVSGVGPKTAYLVISHCDAASIIKAVRQNDVDFFSHIPGLGKKTAMKIILELTQKIKAEFQFEKMLLSDDDKTFIEALVSLGYTKHDASKLLAKIPKDITLEEKISLALKKIAPK